MIKLRKTEYSDIQEIIDEVQSKKSVSLSISRPHTDRAYLVCQMINKALHCLGTTHIKATPSNKYPTYEKQKHMTIVFTADLSTAPKGLKND